MALHVSVHIACFKSSATRVCPSIAQVHPEVRDQAGWLWDILYSLDDEKRAKYYRFVTGSSRRPASVSNMTHPGSQAARQPGGQ